MPQGILFNIQRFSVHDGPGIRTNLFFKGCPLRCAWCHNPEGLSPKPEIAFLASRCTLCGACEQVCPQHVHTLAGNRHLLDRASCVACGKCTDSCGYGALELLGKPYSAEEAVALCKRDLLFYGQSGGVTLTGGEPMLQSAFAATLAKRLHDEGISVCMETSGYAPRAAYETLLPYIDLFLFDIKETCEASHRQYVGVGMEQIQDNLQFLDESGAEIILRCPIVPGINLREDHFRALCNLANRLRNVREIHLEAYHPLGLSKSKRLDKDMPYRNEVPLEREKLIDWQQKMELWTQVPVRVQ